MDEWMIEHDHGFVLNHTVSNHACPTNIKRNSRLASFFKIL